MPQPWINREENPDYLTDSPLEGGQILEVTVYDYDDNEQGHALLRVDRVAPSSPTTSANAWFQATALAIEDGYYQWWLNESGIDHKNLWWHLCSTGVGGPPRENENIIDLYWVRKLNSGDIKGGIPSWAAPFKERILRMLQRSEKPPAPGGGGGRAPPARVEAPALFTEGAGEAQAGAADDATLEDDLNDLRKTLQEGTSANLARASGRDRRRDDSPGVALPRGGGSRTPEGKRGERGANRSPRPGRSLPRGGGTGGKEKAQSLLPAIKKEHKTKKDKKEKKEKKRRSRSRSRSRRRSSKDKKDKHRSQSRSRSRSRRRRRSPSSTDSTDSSETFRFAPTSTNLSAHQRLVEFAHAHPGKLSTSLLQTMERKLCRGEGARDGATDGTPAPVARSFHLRILKPLFPQNSLRNHRELQTLATILDHLASNNPGAAADVASQRFKAIERCMIDQGSWDKAKFLELIEPEERSILSRDEEFMLNKELQAEQKLQGRSRTPYRPSWNTWTRDAASSTSQDGGKGNPFTKGDDGKGAGRGRGGRGRGRWNQWNTWQADPKEKPKDG